VDIEDVMKADVFFFVTTIAVVLVTVLICIFAYYAIRTARAAHHLVNRMHEHVNGFERGADSLKRGVSANMHFAVRAARSIVSALIRPSKKKHTDSSSESR
jgi:hypothetical protein